MNSKSVTKDTYKTVNTCRHFSVNMDNTSENGGENFGATPKEHLCMALGSCTTMTIKMYLTRKNWQIGEITADTKFWFEENQSNFSLKITIQGNFDKKQKKRISQIAQLCPIHKLLSSSSKIEVSYDYIIM